MFPFDRCRLHTLSPGKAKVLKNKPNSNSPPPFSDLEWFWSVEKGKHAPSRRVLRVCCAFFPAGQKARAVLEGLVADLDLTHGARWDHRGGSSLGGGGLPYTDPNQLSLLVLPLTGLSCFCKCRPLWGPPGLLPVTLSWGCWYTSSCPTLTCPLCGSAPHLRPSKDLWHVKAGPLPFQDARTCSQGSPIPIPKWM